MWKEDNEIVNAVVKWFILLILTTILIIGLCIGLKIGVEVFQISLKTILMICIFIGSLIVNLMGIAIHIINK